MSFILNWKIFSGDDDKCGGRWSHKYQRTLKRAIGEEKVQGCGNDIFVYMFSCILVSPIYGPGG